MRPYEHGSAVFAAPLTGILRLYITRNLNGILLADKYTMPTHVSKHCLCSERVSIICSDMDGWWHTVQGNLEEIEEGSALVLAEGPISSNKKVRICCGSKQLKGTVKTCEHDDVLGFCVEVQFDSDSQWSERWFRPNHLLKLSSNLALRAAG